MGAKVLVIGLDGADKDLLLQWSDSGDLPHIQRLRQQGLWAMVTSPPGLGDDAAWATFYTGVSPGRHGRFFYQQVCPGSTEPIWYGDTRLKQESFWEGLSRNGRKVGVIDVPKCTASENLNGLHLVDWLVHGATHLQPRSWPQSLVEEVTSQFGARPSTLCGYQNFHSSQYSEHLAQLLLTLEMKSELSAAFLERENWDLFLTVFKESHCVGHHYWHFLDPTHHDHDPGLVQRLGNPIKQVYMALDTAIGRLMSKVDSDTTVMVFSGLSMGPNYTGNLLLEEVLSRLEGIQAHTQKIGVSWLRSVWKKFPLSLRGALFQTLKRMNHVVTSFEQSLPSYFVVPHNEMSGAIRFNVVGREPNGRIHLGPEYDALCERLSRELMALVCTESGEPIVSKVLRIHDVYEGPFLGHFPDLLVIWNRKRPIAKAWSPKVGEVGVRLPSFRSGNHLPGGILFARGQGISQGHSIGSVDLKDLPATIARQLGVHLPDLEGRPIPEIV